MRSAKHCVIAASVAWFIAGVALAADRTTAQTTISNPFFAFDNGAGRDQHVPIEQQAKMLKELGYAGIGYTGTAQIPEALAALDAVGLKMFSTYIEANVDRGKPPYDPGLKTAIEQLKGRDTVIWLFVRGAPASSLDADDRAVTIIHEIADMAAMAQLRVALYPHTGFYVGRAEDAIRLLNKIDRGNVGLSFNLCHFLKTDDEKNLQQRLTEMLPHLMLVSINGCDHGETKKMGWDRLIQTLDRGSFDVGHVLRVLKQLGYTGPVGLQCYSIPGDPRENLTRSMSAWRKLSGSATVER